MLVLNWKVWHNWLCCPPVLSLCDCPFHSYSATAVIAGLAPPSLSHSKARCCWGRLHLLLAFGVFWFSSVPIRHFCLHQEDPRLVFNKPGTVSQIKRKETSSGTSRTGSQPIQCRTCNPELTIWRTELEPLRSWLKKEVLQALTYSPSLVNCWVSLCQNGKRITAMDFPPENVNNQASIRTRGVPASVSSSEPSSFTFDDVGALLRYVGNITRTLPWWISMPHY